MIVTERFDSQAPKYIWEVLVLCIMMVTPAFIVAFGMEFTNRLIIMSNLVVWFSFNMVLCAGWLLGCIVESYHETRKVFMKLTIMTILSLVVTSCMYVIVDVHFK